MLIPLMAIQVTVLPNYGFSICLTLRHVVADGRSFFHFMKFWAYVCRTRDDNLASLDGSLALPLHKRDIIEEPKELKLIYLKELWNLSLESTITRDQVHDVQGDNDKVRLTFVLSCDHIEKLKKWVYVQCKSYGLEIESLHVSTFVVTCSLIWFCMIKSEHKANVNNVPDNDELCNLSFLADCRNRPKFSIPSTYFGNCLVNRIVSLERGKLVGENGIVEAAVAIGSNVRDIQCDAFKGVERMMSDFTELVKSGQHLVTIAGSPKFNVYEIDFGWGKPKKMELLHIEYSGGSISLSECSDNEGGVQVGLVLGRIQMNKFNTILEEHLRNIAVGG